MEGVQHSSAVRGAMLALVSVLVGCTTVGGGSTATAFLPVPSIKTQSEKSTAILAALNGGLLPPTVLAMLSDSDRLRALEAEYRALESSPGGQAVTWKSPFGRSEGSVTAATPYQVGQQNCRQYSHTLAVDGRQTVGRGVACRNADGSWTPLT